MEKINIKIIIGSTRQNRFGEKPAKWIYEEAKKLEKVEVELLDLRNYPMPFFNSSLSPATAQGKYEDEIVQKWSEKIKEGDAFIIITPEYNHGYPAVLKNAIDVIYSEWNKKPIGFVSYGGVGGARSVEQLRQVAIGLQMAPIRNAIHITGEMFFKAIADRNSQNFEVFEPLREQLQNFLNELLWWAKTLKNGRANK
mgnify:CR=1 FL=1